MAYLSEKVLEALEFAAKAHEGQVRKNPGAIPYFSHPAAVGLILSKAGFGDGVVIAGLLHDVIEDTAYGAEEIKKLFGDRVVELVLGVTENKSLEWDERRLEYNSNLAKHDAEVMAISAADLLANLMSIREEFTKGNNPWDQMSKNPKAYSEKVIRYHSERIKIIRQKVNHPFIDELIALNQEVIEWTSKIEW